MRGPAGRAGVVAGAVLMVLLSACAGPESSQDQPECRFVVVTWTLPDGSISTEPAEDLSPQQIIDTYVSAYEDQQSATETGCVYPAAVVEQLNALEAEVRQEGIAAADWQDRSLPEMAVDTDTEVDPATEGFGIADDEWTAWIISMQIAYCAEVYGPDHSVSIGVEGFGRWGEIPFDSSDGPWTDFEGQGPPSGTVWAFISSGDQIVHQEELGDAAIKDGNTELYVIAEPCSPERPLRTVPTADDLPIP